MKIATILFTYNRPVHTQKVLYALSQNDVRPQKLIIFQDGMNSATDKKDWETVGEAIKNITWFILLKKIKGLPIQLFKE